MSVPRFLVVSLGNPLPLHAAYHSAGHWALHGAQQFLSPPQPAFETEEFAKRFTLASHSMPFTLVQCPTVMNQSGTWVHAAWKHYLKRHQLQENDVALIVVHDELEEAFGEVKPRKWLISHKGHNGVKSIKNIFNRLKKVETGRWGRISIGIDRPVSRKPEEVAGYVLKKMNPEQLEMLKTKVGIYVAHQLHAFRDAWQRELDGIKDKDEEEKEHLKEIDDMTIYRNSHF